MLSGRPDDILEIVKAFEAAGVDHLSAYFGKRAEDFVPTMEAFARDVMPAVVR